MMLKQHPEKLVWDAINNAVWATLHAGQKKEAPQRVLFKRKGKKRREKNRNVLKVWSSVSSAERAYTGGSEASESSY